MSISFLIKKILVFILCFSMSFGSPFLLLAETSTGNQDDQKNDNDYKDNLNSNSIPNGEFYSVHVLGEVKKPGTYRISPSERVSDVLKRAGGVNENGSKRRIQIRRQGTTQALDFYGYETYGWLAQNPYLLENDVIFVPLKKGEIQIEGPVKRPGTYEYTDKLSLLNTINLAGGFASGLSPNEPIRIVRYDESGEKKIIPILNKEKELKKFRIEKGDYIIVPHLFLVDKNFDYNLVKIPGDKINYPTIDASVYVVGEVDKPGAYSFIPAFNYKDYASKAGALSQSNFRRIQIIQKDGRKILARNVKQINAGDTIYVPVKKASLDRIIGLTSVVIGTTLSSILLYNTLKD